MHTLAVDIETYSSYDLKKCGVHRYAEAPDFTILLLGYSFDGAPVQVIDLTLEDFQGEYNRNSGILKVLINRLTDPTVLKTAFDASFERACLAKYFGIDLPPAEWECTMVKSTMIGLPSSLEMVAKILKLDQQKGDGKGLIRYFSIPCKPSKVNGQRTRNLPTHAPEKWAEFITYCGQDVTTEISIRHAIEFFQISPREKQVWNLDQKINDVGIGLDLPLIRNVIRMDDIVRERLFEEAVTLTQVDNPNSRKQLLDWLTVEMPLDDIVKLRKEDIPVIREAAEGYISKDTIQRVLDIRAEMSKTSIKKYAAMVHGICEDGTIKGTHQYYGAATGRWAGRRVQPQNLPINKLGDLDLARQICRAGNLELLEFLFGNVADVFSQLIRTAFIPAKGTKFGMADFSAIEARVIAWLADERWRLEVFATHGEIYEASASKTFGVPIETISYVNEAGKLVKGPNYYLRAPGKVTELALGFQGGPNALKKMDKDKVLKEEELPGMVQAWRNANRNIVRLWWNVQDAAITAVRDNTTVKLRNRDVWFTCKNNTLFITLPSGRKIYYQSPRLLPDKFGKDKLVFWGVDSNTKKWKLQDTYGGKLVENIVQAIARDCLAYAMLRIDKAGLEIRMHVHDEIIIQIPEDFDRVEIDAIMSRPMLWAEGLPLTAESTEGPYYRKD